ncbi:MAG: hypothetical protein K2F67_07625 [Eubacterium sp.]|nr:hypothetical protein [Eubacterium sp.]
MCMGMMNYREQENESTTIVCKGCGRAWQTTKAAAEQFKEQYNSLCNDCQNKSKETVSLLKRKTNNDRINDMSIEEKAEFLYDLQNGDIEIASCSYCEYYNSCYPHCRSDSDNNCIKAVKQWLEREAE